MNAVTKIGRPSLYSDELAEEICERISMGEPLLEICHLAHMPNDATVYRWLEKHERFRDQYTRSREVQADRKFDEAWIIARDATIENAHVARLQVDTIKWQAGKMAPKKYGDLRQVQLAGADGGAIQIEHTQVLQLENLDETQRDQLREILEAARAGAAVDVTPKAVSGGDE